MDKQISKYQKDVLRALSGKMGDFYLAGGTALSLFYFQHRLSVDLDFFTDRFAFEEIRRIAVYLEEALGKKVSLEAQNLEEKMARMVVYNIHFTPADALKIDFVEDMVRLQKKTKIVDGIRILSLEDIYLRKLYALAGMIRILDEAGQGNFKGGRTDAKDFYDVYFLSNTFMPMSKFVAEYCDQTMLEAVVRWFRTFDRMAIMDGLLSLVTNKEVDYKAIERHFKAEVDKIIDFELGDV